MFVCLCVRACVHEGMNVLSVCVCIEIATYFMLTTRIETCLCVRCKYHKNPQCISHTRRVSQLHFRIHQSTEFLGHILVQKRGYVPSKRHLYPQDASNCTAKSTKLLVGSRHLTSQLPCLEYF